MNDIATVKHIDMPLDYAVMEHTLGTGDLSKLTTQQRVVYYNHVCKTLGLNPATRPFRFMSFQGTVVMYATKDCADQLRRLRDISLSIVEQRLESESELFMVTVRATMDGGKRHDEDMGAVSMGPQLRGENRANAILKCITKAKRRVTLSICGLGYNDETEVETLQGARTFDHDEDMPAPPPVVTQANGKTTSQAPQRATNGSTQRTLRMVLDSLKADALNANTPEDVQALRDDDDARKVFDKAPAAFQAELRDAFDQATDRVAHFWEKPAEETDPMATKDADAARVGKMCDEIALADGYDAIEEIFKQDQNVRLVERFTQLGLTHHIFRLEAARKQRLSQLGIES